MPPWCDNFDDESFARAQTGHLAGARVYVTVNVTLSGMRCNAPAPDSSRVDLAHAFIIQDWGLM